MPSPDRQKCEYISKLIQDLCGLILISQKNVLTTGNVIFFFFLNEILIKHEIFRLAYLLYVYINY